MAKGERLLVVAQQPARHRLIGGCAEIAKERARKPGRGSAGQERNQLRHFARRRRALHEARQHRIAHGLRNRCRRGADSNSRTKNGLPPGHLVDPVRVASRAPGQLLDRTEGKSGYVDAHRVLPRQLAEDPAQEMRRREAHRRGRSRSAGTACAEFAAPESARSPASPHRPSADPPAPRCSSGWGGESCSNRHARRVARAAGRTRKAAGRSNESPGEQFVDRAQHSRGLQSIGVAPQHARRASRLLGKVLDQRALAGARFAADERNLAGARTRLTQELRQCLELSLAFQEFHGCARQYRARSGAWVRVPQSGGIRTPNLGRSPDLRPLHTFNLQDQGRVPKPSEYDTCPAT